MKEWEKIPISIPKIGELNFQLSMLKLTELEKLTFFIKYKDIPVIYMYIAAEWLKQKINADELEYCYMIRPKETK